MERPSLDILRAVTRLQGFSWSDAELEAILPLVERSLGMLEHLDELPPSPRDPTIQYRIL